ncbi:hypothetical protein L6164_033370 [Bauhinia variegata]|uniref:Uncharacterized protein n=1 Tax=Bauhinia variegata TaxID=167791 RepID=A0ACB9KRK0_BAUVA|nr:hypothetical protein L6164_033370 [Bauhinia variegata]
MTMWNYLSKVRELCDNLRAIGESISQEDQIMGVLAGLGAEYNAFVASAAFENLSIENVHNHLMMFDKRIEKQRSVEDTTLIQANIANSNVAKGKKRFYPNTIGNGYNHNKDMP